VLGFAGGFNRAGHGAGHDDLDAGAAENINDGDGFDLLETRREWDEHLFHGAG
jgi:hypothetical protein